MSNAIKGYVFTFTVVGRGKFPMDMLRYDECYPRTGADAENIAPVDRPVAREVVLNTVQDRKHWQPTVGRWQSFGWSVVPTLRGYEDEAVSYTEVVR